MAIPEEQVIEFTKWGFKWMKFGFKYAIGYTPERETAKGLLAAFDACESEPIDYVVKRETHLTVIERDSKSEKITVDNKKSTTRIKKGTRTTFAMALAKRAYVKFGPRPVSEANVLVTRKWMTKLIEDEFKDLRTCDKALALDRAVFLSFVPTMAHNNYKFVFNGNNAVTERIGGKSLFSRIAHWANPSE
nr:MAG: hypothetical protein [Tombusviridae sp.]